MDRRLRHRIRKIEQLLSDLRKEREEKKKKDDGMYLRHARFHATAVAAIVLSGEPKIDEPLVEAWTRALQHYGISASQEYRMDLRYGMNLKPPTRIGDQVEAAEKLFRVIIGREEEAAKFTEIFRTAPTWLLAFTGTFFDAAWLKFDLPHKPLRAKWGRAGLEESWGWPLLPLGMMTDGDLLSDSEAQLWPVQRNKTKKVEPVATSDNNLPPEQDDSPSPAFELLQDLKLCLDLAKNPEREKDLSRYEKVRLRNLFKYLSSGQRSGND
jgi:hypothetical protein